MALQHCQTELINHASSKCDFAFDLMVAVPLCNFGWLYDPCCDLYQLISTMATIDKKRRADGEGFQERWKLQNCFTKNETAVFA